MALKKSVNSEDESRVFMNSEEIEQLQSLIQTDCQLLPEITFGEGPSLNYAGIQTVLLIGVTGMLGPYVLMELSKRPQIKKIYCLIRRVKNEVGLERLHERLETTGVWEMVDLVKINCIIGDISKERLGLSQGQYDNLSENIDAVVNLATFADYTREYSQEPGKDTIRNVNVIGTLNVLKFLVNKTLKCAYFASNLLCAVTGIQFTCFSESWQDEDGLEDVTLNFGYSISKYVSEQLLKQAVERGIPVKVFRFGLFGGDSKTGRCDFTNQFSLFWLTILKLGYIPNLLFPLPIFPIDFYAKLSLQVFFNSEAPPDVYNVCGNNPPSFKTLADISSELGVSVKQVSVKKFALKLKKAGEEPLPLGDFQGFYFTQRFNIFKQVFNYRVLKVMRKVLEEEEVVFENYKMAKYIPGINNLGSAEAELKKDLRFLMESGVFEKYGII